MKLSAAENAAVLSVFKDVFRTQAHAIDLFGNSQSNSLLDFSDEIQAKEGLDHNWLRSECARRNILPEVLLEIGEKFDGYERAVRLAWHLNKSHESQDENFLKSLEAKTAKLPFDEAAFSSLEGLVSANPYLDVDELSQWAERVKRVVCRIRCGGNDAGTGFLVAPD
ncbi:MAG: hypothetical protein R3C18_27440 [Planctomycetaceae bacterium]